MVGRATVLGNLQCWRVLLIKQWPTVLAIGAEGDCFATCSLAYHISLLSASFWKTAGYRAGYTLKYCLKSKPTTQPTNQPTNQPFKTGHTVDA